MDYMILLAILIINFCVSQMGIFCGYTVNGVVIASVLSAENPGVFGVVEWIWDSSVFLFQLTTFQVDGVPAILTLVFLVMQLMVGYIILKLIRGN